MTRIPGTTYSDDDGFRIDAGNFCGTLNANVNNLKVTDAEFRQLCRNTLDSVRFDRPRSQTAYIYFDKSFSRAKRVFAKLGESYPHMQFELAAPDAVGTIYIQDHSLDLDFIHSMQVHAAEISRKLKKRKTK